MRNVRSYALIVLSATSMTACYVVPVARQDGSVTYQHYPLPIPGSAAVPSGGSGVANLSAKLYPANELAARTGIVSGTVTNLMTGKGLFQVNYLGEVLTGEATRVSNSDRRGVANAFSPRGTYMSCEYQMSTPYQGAGSCTFSNGAKYDLHLGGS